MQHKSLAVLSLVIAEGECPYETLYQLYRTSKKLSSCFEHQVNFHVGPTTLLRGGSGLFATNNKEEWKILFNCYANRLRFYRAASWTQGKVAFTLANMLIAYGYVDLCHRFMLSTGFHYHDIVWGLYMSGSDEVFSACQTLYGNDIRTMWHRTDPIPPFFGNDLMLATWWALRDRLAFVRDCIAVRSVPGIQWLLDNTQYDSFGILVSSIHWGEPQIKEVVSFMDEECRKWNHPISATLRTAMIEHFHKYLVDMPLKQKTFSRRRWPKAKRRAERNSPT